MAHYSMPHSEFQSALAQGPVRANVDRVGRYRNRNPARVDVPADNGSGFTGYQNPAMGSHRRYGGLRMESAIYDLVTPTQRSTPTTGLTLYGNGVIRWHGNSSLWPGVTYSYRIRANCLVTPGQILSYRTIDY